MNCLDLLKRLARTHGVMIVIGAVFLLAGLGLLGWGLGSTFEAMQSREWPNVGGTLVESNVVSYQDSSDDGSQTTMYKAVVRYTYVVDGKAYQGEQVSLGDFSSSNAGAMRKIIKRYPVGAGVRVYYRPGEPEQAVLEPGFSAGLLIPLGIGLVFSVVGGLISFWLFRRLLAGQMD